MALFHPPSKAIISITLLILLLSTTNRSFSYPLKTSSISLSPSSLPKMPKFSYVSPTLSPDVMPIFPSPATGDPPSNDFPTIPSSPSPPNPDDLEPNSAFAPFGSMATATSSGEFLGDTNRARLVNFASLVVLLWWL